MASPVLDRLTRDPATRRLARALADGARTVATGAIGSLPVWLAAALAQMNSAPIVLVRAHLDDAEDDTEELTHAGIPVLRLPAMEALPGESSLHADLLAERLTAVRAAGEIRPDQPMIVIASIHALMQRVPAPAAIAELVRTAAAGQRLEPDALIAWLASAGYERTDAIESPGEFSVRGGIIDVFTPGGGDGRAVRLDFFGDEIEAIFEIDLDTMGSDRRIEQVEIIAARPDASSDDTQTGNTPSGQRKAKGKPARPTAQFLDLLPPESLAVLVETMEAVEQGRGYYERVTDATGVDGPPAVLKVLSTRFRGFCELNQYSTGAADAAERIELPVSPLPIFDQDAAKGIEELGELASRHSQTLVTSRQEAELARLRELLTEFAPEHASKVESWVAPLHAGFIWGDANDDSGDANPLGSLCVVGHHELLHRPPPRGGSRKVRAGRAMDTFLEFEAGDHVVHAEHGIARFVGLKRMTPNALPGRPASGEPEEFLTLEFAGRSRLHVPATQIDLVQRYVGGFSGKPPLSTVGGKKWRTQKERVADSVHDLAGEMLRVRAARDAAPGVRFPADTKWQNEFEAEFPFDETEDQLAAIAEIKRDMQHDRPMDRLLCGDVGFGKTELAIRAAFKACEFGKQVAILCPTTVLAEQHARTFGQRFSDYPFRVESLSRFKTNKEINGVLASLRKGQVDVVIGTHRLLSADVRFADLGLVVVDEEQRFGVEHKERLLRLRTSVDVLTLSATPIPRTLHMAMLGLRDISNLTTPPADRRAIVTEVLPSNERRIARAIERELSREGQVYFVHNRVHSIKDAAERIQKLAPEARIVVGHGQMAPKDLERVMLTFMQRRADVLVATTIIESGIDISTANTMIIDDADRFGLADLHQLRGRVGRSGRRAYCYLLTDPKKTLTEVSRKRLQAVERYSMLGAGFKIAMRDLEIRGAGNLLGAEQSGHIAAVGYEMYCRLLEDAVRTLNRESTDRTSQTTIEIGLSGTIPKVYIPSDARRLEAYRRLTTADSVDGVDRVEEDLRDAYGEPPTSTARLLDLARARASAAGLGIRAIVVRGPDVVFRTATPERVESAMAGASGALRTLAPDKRDNLHEVYYRPPPAYLEPETLLPILTRRLGASSLGGSDRPADKALSER